MWHDHVEIRLSAEADDNASSPVKPFVTKAARNSIYKIAAPLCIRQLGSMCSQSDTPLAPHLLFVTVANTDIINEQSEMWDKYWRSCLQLSP
jgi:hypothetical protein